MNIATVDADSAERLRAELVANLQRDGVLGSGAVAAAFGSVPRELFVPGIAASDGIARAYADVSHATKLDPGGNVSSSSSQPAVMAAMLERLELRPGLRVLEVGAGTGYNAALLATLVGPRGRVWTIDVDQDVAAKAQRALTRGGYCAEVVAGDGLSGLAAHAPFDRIIVTATPPHVPRAWLDQLVEGGLLQTPLYVTGHPNSAVPVVATLRRRGERLVSASLTYGGFIPFRHADGTLQAPSEDWATIAVRRAGRRTTLGLQSNVLRSLGPSQLGRLLALHVVEPRRTALAHAADNALVLYLSWTGLRRALAWGWESRAITVVLFSPRGDGLVRLPCVTDRTGRLTIGEALATGSRRFEQRVLRALRDYERAGRPGLGDFELTIEFATPRPDGGHVVARLEEAAMPVGLRSARRRR